MSDTELKKVFISYSWKCQEKVKEIVDDLISNGIQVIFDLYDLNPGDDIPFFMERSVNDPSVDFVLIFSDQTYADKADCREDGVGTETLIIAKDAYESKDKSKFIPLALEKDSNGVAFMPCYLKGRYYIDLSSNEKYEEGLEKLVRHIYDVPSHRKPSLGNPPAYFSDSKYDLSSLRNCIHSAKSSVHLMLIPEMINSTFDAYQRIFVSTELNIDSFYDSLNQTIDVRDLVIDFISELIKHKEDPGDFVVRLMESIGDLRAEFPSSIHNDLVSFIQWELFLSVVAVYIYIEDYAGINKFLHRTYYMYVRGQSKNSYNYRYFHDSCRSLDEYYKLHDLGNKYSAMADTLMNRTNASILTKARLISADMLVYHLYPFVFTDRNYWFPLTYIYQTKSIVLSLPWPKLESKDQYNRIAPLLGGITLDEFKSRMNYPYNFTMGYNEVMFNYALWITDYIDPNAVGSRD